MIRVARVPSRLAAFCQAARQSVTGVDIGALSPETTDSPRLLNEPNYTTLPGRCARRGRPCAAIAR